jgi:hypothetical protein
MIYLDGRGGLFGIFRGGCRLYKYYWMEELDSNNHLIRIAIHIR